MKCCKHSCSSENCFIKKAFTFICTFRRLFVLCFLASIFFIAASHIIEIYFYVIPCQLCLLQRFIFYVLAPIFFIGALHNPTNIGRYIYSLICFVLSIFGMIIAGRQIWIQHLPSINLPECAPGLDRLLNMYPLLEVMKILFKGTNECFKVHFKIFGLPISNWSFIGFLAFAFVCLFIMYKQKKRWQ